MPKVRKEIPELEKLVQVGRKKVVRYEEGAQLYSMGLHTVQNCGMEKSHTADSMLGEMVQSYTARNNIFKKIRRC